MVFPTRPEKVNKGALVIWRDGRGALRGPARVTGAPRASLFGVAVPVEGVEGEEAALAVEDVRRMWTLTGSDEAEITDHWTDPRAVEHITAWYEGVCR